MGAPYHDAKSADWIHTEYLILAQNGTFTGYGGVNDTPLDSDSDGMTEFLRSRCLVPIRLTGPRSCMYKETFRIVLARGDAQTVGNAGWGYDEDGWHTDPAWKAVSR